MPFSMCDCNAPRLSSSRDVLDAAGEFCIIENRESVKVGWLATLGTRRRQRRDVTPWCGVLAQPGGGAYVR